MDCPLCEEKLGTMVESFIHLHDMHDMCPDFCGLPDECPVSGARGKLCPMCKVFIEETLSYTEDRLEKLADHIEKNHSWSGLCKWLVLSELGRK